MPAFTEFNFYKAAYKINQGFGSAQIPLTDIKMGTSTSPLYRGLAFHQGKTFYADMDYVGYNSEFFNISSASFSTSTTGSFHSAANLANCNFGPATPLVNDTVEFGWDRCCYPCALGDTRDNEKYNDVRDGSWVEAGNENGTNYINIYTSNTNTTTEPIWTNSITVNHNFNPGFPNCRVFTSPSLSSSTLVKIAYFAWSPTGNGGNPILYYELFGWDPSTNIIGSINSGIDITTTFFGYYTTFTYTGKHDMFHTAQWVSNQNYGTCNFLSVLTNDDWLVQFDLATGNPGTPVRANAGAYSDVYDIFAYVDNVAKAFFTISGRFGLSAGIIDSQTLAVASLNVFDGDYRPFPLATGQFGYKQDDFFYFADDQQAAANRIIGWSLQIDGAGNFSSGGLRSESNSPTSGTFPPYLLKRAVLVSPMQLILGSGPGFSTYPLIRITCNCDASIASAWYRAGIVTQYGSGTYNEDYIAMFHGFCEDYTGYFHPSGTYNPGVIAAPSDGLPVGAGNGHLITVNATMNVSLHNHNTAATFYSEDWPGSPMGVHNNYILYLGKATWGPATYGNAYMYINITGGADFLRPNVTQGQPATFAGGGPGMLRLLTFYTS